MSDDSTEPQPVVAEPSPRMEPTFDDGTVVSFESDGVVAAEQPPEADKRRSYRVPVLVGVGALLAVILGTGAWIAGRATTAVPNVAGLRVPEATARIAGAELATGPMGAFATSVYQKDVVIEHMPTLGTEVSLGAPVDLLVAVAPTPTVVPDVSLDTTLAAKATLDRALLTPVVYEQLSDSVDYGRVVAQMPRAGQQVMTGQQVALFVSVGRGVGGAVVPDVLGKTVDEAARSIADAFLVAVLFDVRSAGSPGDTVADQVPAPGTRVPIGSAVPLVTAAAAN